MVSAFDKAVDLLSRRDHFPAELAAKLRQRGYPPGEIEAALARCRELGYLDEERLAARFVEVRAVQRGWGPRRLRAELEKRGAPREVAAAAAGLGTDLLAAALETALARAERRRPAGWWVLPEERARMVSSLVNRGFDPSTARDAVEELARRRETDDHASHDERGDPPELP